MKNQQGTHLKRVYSKSDKREKYTKYLSYQEKIHYPWGYGRQWNIFSRVLEKQTQMNSADYTSVSQPEQ